MRESDKWIKSKIVVFFGMYDRFADMFNAIASLVYPFPYYYKIYDDIPRFSESASNVTMDYKDKSVSMELKSINGTVSMHMTVLQSHSTEFEDSVKIVEELFGNQ
jgi:hypothetical protein